MGYTADVLVGTTLFHGEAAPKQSWDFCGFETADVKNDVQGARLFFQPLPSGVIKHDSGQFLVYG